MKEHGDGESNMATTRPPPLGLSPTDRQMQNRTHLQHLVNSNAASPPYPISYFNPLFGADPRALLSAHLLASLQMASNVEGAFQIPISLSPQTTPPQLYHSSANLIGQVTGLPPPTHPNAQLNIYSSWVNNNEDMKISTGNKHAGHKHKRDSNWSVTKTNKRNKQPVQLQNGLIGSDIHIDIKKEMGDEMNGKRDKQRDNESEAVIKSEMLPLDKIGKMGQHVESQPVNNNNNIIGNIQQQQSNNQQPREKKGDFTCEICNRAFGYKHVLQNHQRTHTGEKPFECTICQKKFTRDHHLKTHMRLHTGEKPYQCPHCDRLFVQVANLRRHLRVHTGERPYACDLCQSRFSDSNQLKAHMLIHKGEKPYTCPGCDGRFRRRHHLLHHKCNNKEASPPESSPQSSPQGISPPSSGGKRERKPRETRRIIRIPTHAVSTAPSSPMVFGQIIPEQTHPEDLSLNHGNGMRGRHYSGSHSSCSASPSPASGGSHGSIMYCRSITSSDPADYSSDEDQSVTASSSTNGKTESDEASPHA